jgi:heptosyltransferase-3
VSGEKGFEPKTLKILIIRPAALGDTLMLLPSLHALRGTAETTLVGRHPGIDFVMPYVHRAVDYEGRGWHFLFMEGEAPIFESRLLLPSVDLAVMFHADPDGKIAARLEAVLPGATIRLFPGFPPPCQEIHVALYLARCLEASGCPVKPQFVFQEAFETPLLARAGSEGHKATAVFHPGSGSRKKNYPSRFWLDFVHRFCNTTSLPFTLLLGPAEEEMASVYRLSLGQGRGEILFCPQKERLHSLLSQACLYVGHDSGITHLAAMLGAPTLALFRNTSVARWRPLGPKVRIIQGENSDPGLLDEALAQAEALLREEPGFS